MITTSPDAAQAVSSEASVTPIRPLAPDALHTYLARVLCLRGAVPCAEGDDKTPIRWKDLDPDQVRVWLTQRGGVGTIWEQYGFTHAALAPVLGQPAGFVLPPTASLVCLDLDFDACSLQGILPGDCREKGCRHRHGLRELGELAAVLGALPATLVTRSKGGGLHLWFALPQGVVVAGSGKLQGKAAIDCKGNGGAYVAEIGRGRELVGGEHEVAMLPSAWLDALPRVGQVTEPGAMARDGELDPDENWTVYCAETHSAAIEAHGGGGLAVKLLGKEAGRRNLRFAPALDVAWRVYNPRCIPPFGHGEFSRRFRAFYDPAETVEAERFAAAVFADAFPAQVALTQATPQKAGNSPLSFLELPKAGQKVTTAAVAKYFATHDHWRDRLRWDSFAQVVRAFGVDLGRGLMNGEALTDADFALLRTWYLAVHHVEPKKSELFDGVVQASREWAYHPVQDYLRSARSKVECSTEAAHAWIDASFTEVFGAPLDPIELVFLRKTLLAAVRRAFEPGCKCDTVLVLVGGQGLFKSTLLAELFGPQWFGDSFVDIRQKDAAINLAGKWCYELAELASIRKDDLERVRSFVTSSSDRFRAPYGTVAEDHARGGVLCGTSNEREVLYDPEGLRRWWTVDVLAPLSIAALRRDRDHLWGLARMLVERGEPHHLDATQEAAAKIHRERFTSHDPWQEDVSAYCRGQATVRGRSLLEQACGVSAEGAGSQSAHRRLARLLRAMGFERLHTAEGKAWRVPGHLASAPAAGGIVLQFPGAGPR